MPERVRCGTQETGVKHRSPRTLVGQSPPCQRAIALGMMVARMKVGLFIPCYIEQLYPSVGLATVEVLERHGVEVEYPEGQTCCGQPMLNSGAGDAARPLVERFLRIFGSYDHVVCPSGSCVSMVRTHYRGLGAE